MGADLGRVQALGQNLTELRNDLEVIVKITPQIDKLLENATLLD